MNLQLSVSALATIQRLCRANPGVETGGLVLGTPDGFIVGLTGPGPRAVLERARLAWDPSYIAGVLDGVQLVHAQLRPIGRWHKHVSPVLAASPEDRAGAYAFRRALGTQSILDIVIATGDGDEPIGIAAYRCTCNTYERIFTDQIAVPITA